MNDPSIKILLEKNRTGWVWPTLYLVTLAVFSAVVLVLVHAFGKERQYIVIDDQAYYMVKAVDFSSARQMHLDQAELATITLLNRNPQGFDSERRLKYLFDVPSYQKAVGMAEEDASAFKSKSLHQKVEMFETKIQKLTNRSVQVLVDGQLIRTGLFEGEVFNEVLRFQLRMTFVDNPSLVENGRFPTVVQEFTLNIEAPR